jgi:hypothetical protein
MSIGSFVTLILCGRVTSTTKRFNQQTNIEQVREYVRHSFGSDLPQSYRIVCYDAELMSFVDLEEHLRNGSSLFQSNSSVGVEETTSISNSIQLFIVDNNSDIRSRIGRHDNNE